MKLLVIEDEPGLRESIKDYFANAGYVCEIASDYPSAYQKVSLYRYDCIILDITLPGGTGLQILDELKRKRVKDGVLIISAKDSLDDRVQGLELGADDYLVKPFHLSELAARMMAIVRRKSFEGDQIVTFNEINVDMLAFIVTVNDQPIKLTKKEFNLLLYFIANKHKVISKSAIAEYVCGDQIDISDNFDFIYSHIKNLRKKIMDKGGKDYIQSAYGMGYKFTDA